MFENLKQLKKLKELKSVLEKERQEVEIEGTKITVNGKMEIEQVILNPELDKEKQEKIIKECFNQAVRKIQEQAAQKMMQM